MTQTFGKITVTGTSVQIAFAQKAYAGQTRLTTIQDALIHPYAVEFHTAAEFIARKLFIPGTKAAAWGYTLNRRVLWVNSDEPKRHQVYTLRHEPGHALQDDLLTPAKKAALLPLMTLKGGGHPTGWHSTGTYYNHPSEILADALIEAFWGPGTPLDHYYGDIADADLQPALAILLAPDPAPVDPPVEPIPLPLPDPKDAQITQLTAALQSCQVERDAALEKIVAAKRDLA